MQISYIVDETDLRHFADFVSKRYTSGALTLLKILWWLVLFDILMMLFALEKEPNRGSVFFVLFYILTFLVSAIVIIRFIQRNKKTDIKLLSKHYGGKLELQIDKDGITESNPFKKTFYSWECAEAIHDEDEYIIIELDGDMCYTIRKKSMEGEDPQTFYNVAKHFLDEHKNK